MGWGRCRPAHLEGLQQHNVVLARDRWAEVVLTGRALGFQARPGQRVDESKVVRTFVPEDGRNPDNVAAMLA